MNSNLSINNIAKSRNGVSYVCEELGRKTKVCTRAILQKIPHNNRENDEVKLKIGRYWISGEKETNEPKSELTLGDEELRNLISFIDKNYEPLNFGASRFISLDNDERLSGVLQQFADMVGTDDKKVSLLLKSGILSDKVSYLIELSKRKVCVEEFFSKLKEDNSEQFWQKWFLENKWMLGSEFSQILDERGIDSNHIADYLMKTNDGFIDIVEIKKPNGNSFWANSKNHGNYIPSSDLIKAIVQCQHYLFEMERESNNGKYLQKLNNSIIAKPRCLLVFGRSNNWDDEKFLALRLLNASLNQLSVITYDQLGIRASSMLGLDIQRFE